MARGVNLCPLSHPMLDFCLARADANAVQASTATLSWRAELAYCVQKMLFCYIYIHPMIFYNHFVPSLVMFSKPWRSRECDIPVLFRAEDFTIFSVP